MVRRQEERRTDWVSQRVTLSGVSSRDKKDERKRKLKRRKVKKRERERELEL